jgi:hypothetical protein
MTTEPPYFLRSPSIAHRPIRGGGHDWCGIGHEPKTFDATTGRTVERTVSDMASKVEFRRVRRSAQRVQDPIGNGGWGHRRIDWRASV